MLKTIRRGKHIHPLCKDRAVTVPETGVRIRVNATRGQCANDLCNRLAVYGSPRVERVVFTHFFQNGFDTLVQFCLCPFFITRNLLIRRNSVHQHTDHINVIAVRPIFMIE